MPADVHGAALLADARRREYEAYSPVFWRPATDAFERHEPWLAQCIAADDQTSFAADAEDGIAGIAIAAHSASPPPFRFDEEPTWLIDDFYVQDSAWSQTGRPLLDAVAEAASRAGARKLVVISARRDEPKSSMLHTAGYERAASWWVQPVDAVPGEPSALAGTTAAIGPAPPVYDPRGLTALALEMRDPADAATFLDWASASNAVVAIVPARSSDVQLEAALAESGYEVASDWFVRGLSL